ncbi:hypothetical protein [Jannaschia aquimarina]|uniref:Uncharacterized protein n=1 Tax=Jannaschia aquimarina TaxID=935700 RepID=A0A0D1EFV7_9RHOB|nr:hypothetical protein [Jannaschia aquimarina]KIT16574.1 hypothetical protein jaqu_16690 [Jannaschia aquimarina]SNT41648.1 hypothetical protein SAMN05421775_11724 [Jannaschia aquimarina]
MTRPLSLIAVLGLLSGCVSAQDREARCSCFTQEGNPTGNCDFAALPPGPGGVGGRPVFKFLSDDQAATLARSSRSPTGTLPHKGAQCRG